MDAIREAVHRQMKRLGHSQPQVAELAGVSQSNVSRLLSGQRKRITAAVHALCRYAEYEPITVVQPVNADERLSQLLQGAIGDNADAAKVMARVLEALAPLLRTYKPIKLTESGAEHDDSRAH